jgi:3-hydroxybutyryl-CoA dehydrogenase
MDRLSFSSDLAKAVANADLVIESVPEDPSNKKDFYKKLAVVALKPFSLVILQCS